MDFASGPAVTSGTGRHGPRAAIDRGLGRALSLVCGSLLLIEIVLMLVGVISRYVFHRPLVWADEFSSVFFLWLAMLGAVLALRGSSHMRMSAIVNKVSPGTRVLLGKITTVLIFLFLVAILLPSLDYVGDERGVSLATVDISRAWRAAAMPVSLGLMLLTMLLRLELRPRRLDWVALALVAAIVGVLVALMPVFAGLGKLNLLIFFLGVAGSAVFVGIPIAFSFGLATLGYIGLTTYIPVAILVSRMDAGMTSPVLLAIPLFVFLGLLVEMTGMAQAIVGFLANLLGHIRGGLSYVLIVAMYLISGISGSKAADMAAIAPVLFPEMVKRGVPRGDLVALLASTGAQTETIPPSLILITIGSVTGVSIAALFTGGLLPGLVSGLFIAGIVWHKARTGTATVLPRAPRGLLLKSLYVAIPSLILPLVIRTAIVEGIATATEVSTIGIVYATLCGLLIYRAFDWGRVWPMLIQTATLSGAILLIVGAATAMSWAITQSGLSRGVALWIAGAPGGATNFLALSSLIFIVLGSVLEGIPAVVLMGPLLFPIAHSAGINEVHYAMVAVLSMGIGLFAPPFGVGYYVACAIGECSPDDGLPYIGRYILALVVGLLVVMAVPWISTGFL
jgi:tripartite ATP-independent transporter DctM subunit